MKDDLGSSERLSARDIRGDMGPQDASEWTQLATALMRSEKYQEAVDMLYVAIQCDPEAGRAWYALGLCYYSLGRMTDAREALEIARCNGGPAAQIDACLRRLALLIRNEKERVRREEPAGHPDAEPEVDLSEADRRQR